MPYSSQECKKEIKEWFDSRTDIKTIIDVGPGCGTYPKLLGKNYKWTGIEIYEPYVEEFKLRDIYDEIIIGDFFDVIAPLEADCLILGDVLEHMKKRDASLAIKIADENFKHVVISTPINYEQEGTENPYEKHLSVWSMEEINSMVPPSFTVRGLSWDIALFIK